MRITWGGVFGRWRVILGGCVVLVDPAVLGRWGGEGGVYSGGLSWFERRGKGGAWGVTCSLPGSWDARTDIGLS